MHHAGESISHPGIIDKVDDRMVYVKILSASACSSCHIKGACNLAESAEKTIEITKRQGIDYTPGKAVEVTMGRSSGSKAVILAYLVPFSLVVITLIVCSIIGISEGLTALTSLLMPVPYYLVLSRYKDKLKRTFEFNVQFK